MEASSNHKGPWETVLLDVKDEIAWVTLNRPAKRSRSSSTPNAAGRLGCPSSSTRSPSARAWEPMTGYCSPVRTDVMRSVLNPSQCIRPT